MGESICSFAGGRLTFLKLDSTSAGFGGCVWKFFESQDSWEVSAYHDKSTSNSLTCSVCLLMMGSECVGGLGEGSNFQLVRGPQN